MLIEPVGPVIVGVDGSSESMLAVDFAADEAMGRVTPLVVVHAVGGPEAARPVDTLAPVSTPRLSEGRRLTAVAVARAEAEHPGLAVSAELIWGEAASALAARSRRASLLVVGHGRRGTDPKLVLERLMRQASVPVMVHRSFEISPLAPQPRPVLVGVQSGPGAESVIQFAFDEAYLRGAPLLAVHVWARPSNSGSAESGSDWFALNDARYEARRMLADALARWSDKYPGVQVYRVVRHALDVPVALTAASRAAQLAVVGVTRWERLHGSVAGSVSAVLLHRAGCPVAVIPHD